MTSAPPPAPPAVDPPAWQPPPPPPPPPHRPQLSRSRIDKMIGGVSGGLAEYSGVDALLWRVGFVTLTLAGGSGILVYLLLWLLMPAGPPLGPGETAVWTAHRGARPPAGPRSPVPGVTIAGLLILIGALTLLTDVGGWDIGPRGFLGTALLVVGAGLVAAAFTGGRSARGGLIALGLVLSLALIAVSSGPWHDASSIGDQTFRPISVDDVRPTYNGGIGDLTLDLSDLEFDDVAQPVSTSVQHGIGDVEVIVPRSADVRIEVQNGLGSVDLFGGGHPSDAYFPGSGSETWTDDGDAEIVLRVNSGLGDVEVSRG